MSTSTLLRVLLDGVDILAPYSARGLTQTLEPIEAAAQMRRVISGTLRDISQNQFRKYKSSISCNDQDVPGLEGIWQGMQVVLESAQELAYPTDSRTPERTPVSGSERTANGFSFYRPTLTMLVTAYNLSYDEYGHQAGWQLDLEEK